MDFIYVKDILKLVKFPGPLLKLNSFMSLLSNFASSKISFVSSINVWEIFLSLFISFLKISLFFFYS